MKVLAIVLLVAGVILNYSLIATGSLDARMMILAIWVNSAIIALITAMKEVTKE